jgi:hypothetical protein
MKSFKEFLVEAEQVSGRQVSEKELVTILGKAKTKSLLKNPFFSDYANYQKAYKYTRAKEPNDMEKRWGPSAGWNHLSDWKEVKE